jgi:hypothetical protein
MAKQLSSRGGASCVQADEAKSDSTQQQQATIKFRKVPNMKNTPNSHKVEYHHCRQLSL